MRTGETGVTNVRRFVCRHRSLIGLPILMLAINFYISSSMEGCLISGILAMGYFWCLMLEANDSPGEPLRRNIRILQTGFLGGAIAVVGATIYLIAAHFQQR